MSSLFSYSFNPNYSSFKIKYISLYFAKFTSTEDRIRSLVYTLTLDNVSHFVRFLYFGVRLYLFLIILGKINHSNLANLLSTLQCLPSHSKAHKRGRQALSRLPRLPRVVHAPGLPWSLHPVQLALDRCRVRPRGTPQCLHSGG